ncbi:hypothetical protein SAMN04487886_100329 [Clostridium sp. DSM 8431]|uniref:PDZ domain-containing protein n=1 Tax=Clostridium sp. DSM 8431 TaxID=1761781 RepID=UPI0008EAAC1D|nr:PDZ domain-containing protein [Clostridium sp. DSM 8431]SFU29370.1 hypothetical protein SAMN04487886_100329 [Clostridium sp. DSM 8431]
MNLIIYTLRSLSYVITEPSLMIVLVLLGVLFYGKNRKIVTMQKIIIGDNVNSALELTLSQIVLGIFAGVFASIILTNLGVIFSENSGIELMFVISIVLAFVKPRYICFSYSGAILGIISLIFTYFNITTSRGTHLFDLDITMLMTFVGVSHFVEGILVMFDGSRGYVPVFSNKNGKIIGGYALRRYWIVPIAIFVAYSSLSIGTAGTESISTPDWWPILGYDSVIKLIETSILTLSPLIGMIGYSSVSFTRRKKAKSLSSGIFICVYGILLTLVAQVAKLGIAGEILVIIFAPLGHEAMLLLQRKLEDRRKPLFVSDEEGVAVLDVVPYSTAYNLGLREGDKIALVNGVEINSEADIYTIAKENFNSLEFEVIDRKKNKKNIKFRYENNTRLGFVLVPKFVDMKRVVSFEGDKFSKVLDNIKKNKK